MKKPILWAAVAVVVVCAAALTYSWWSGRQKAPLATVAPAATEPAPAVQNPVPEPHGSVATALPPLGASDASVHASLTELLGAKPLDDFLVPDNIVRHIVVTIDNLPRHRVAVELRPLRPVAGQFMATGDEQASTLAAANDARYAPYLKLLQMLEPKQFAAVYFREYPLFQQAYQDLGYPNGYFNDRLVETIDDLLATPDVAPPIALVRPNVMYQYADAQLESLSAGQKLLLRMGADNRAAVKARLRELRAEIASRTRGDNDTRQRTP